MTDGSSRLQRLKEKVFRAVLDGVRRITEPPARVEPKQRRRIRLLVAFMLIMSANTFIGSLYMRNIDGDTWEIMLTTAIIFILGYFISRTKHYRIALGIAITAPAIPSVVFGILQPPEFSNTTELMWLTLPLMVAGLMLTVRQTILIAATYLLLISALGARGLIEFGTMAQVLSFISIITFFVLVITFIRNKDQTELENQLSERTRVEETLRESEEKFYKAFHASPESISINKLEDGEFIEVNDSFLRSNGFTREEIIGHSASEVTLWANEGDRERMTRLLKEQGRISNKEFQFKVKSGEIRTVLLSADLITIGGEPCTIVVSTDITERKQTEEAFREREKRFNDIAENALEWIWEVDNEGKYTYSSPVVEKILGYKPEEILEHHFYDFFLPEQREKLKKAAFEAFSREEPIKDLINENRCKNGKTVYLMTSGVPVIGEAGNLLGYRGVDTDITERKIAEEALKANEERFRLIADNSTDLISRIQVVPEVRTDYASPSCLHITGYSQEEFYNDPNLGLQMIHPEDREFFLKNVTPDKKSQGQPITVRLVRKDGRIVWIEQTHTIIYNERGEPVAVHLIAHDITERRRSEQALKESEEKFSVAFNSSPNSISITTIEDGVFVEVNESFMRDNGYTREEIIGRSSKELGIWAQPAERERILGKLKKKGRVVNEEFQARRKSGEIHTMLFSAEPINMAGKACMLAATVDITERKKTEEALRESEERFSKAFRSSPETIAITTFKEGRFIEVNDSFTRITGYTREEVIGRSSTEINIWADARDRARMLNLLKKNGTVYSQEYEFRMKTGEIRTWLFSAEKINIGGEPCLISITTDITERKKAEEMLRLSDASFKSIHESVIVTNLKGEITNWNKISEQLFGVKASEAIGRKFLDVIEVVETYPGESQDRIKKIQTQGHWEDERLYRTKKGGIWVDVHLQDIVDNGKHYGRVMLASDITQRKQAEAELKRALADLEQSSALLTATNKELEAFSYSVSHDLRSPLRSIDGFSQALLEDYQDRLDKTGQDYLKRLRGASQKMGELIDGLLKLSRLTRSEMHLETVNLSSLAEEIATRLQETQPERRVEFVIDKGLTANGDPQLLRALLENLLGNAWKFTGNNPEAKIEFSLESNGEQKAYFIRDNGAGFDMTYADKLFGAFQRLHGTEEFPGTGIGLATVQRIINRHGGTIRAEGVVGKGATFHFTLN